MAPPEARSRATASPELSNSHSQGYSNVSLPGSIEELFESSPSPNEHVKPDDKQGMMDLINSTNARTDTDHKGMEFPEMLSQYENANGNSPLTPAQRSSMLSMMAKQSSVPGTDNALVSPTPPPQLSLGNLRYTQAELDELSRLHAAQEARIREVCDSASPYFSPPGDISGVNDDEFPSGLDAGSSLDLDQFLDAGAFYSGGSPVAGSNGFEYDGFNDGQFDLGMDNTNNMGRIIETSNSSGANTPEEDLKEAATGGTKSPSKRRRKN
jgi:heat shock transcription factor